jgi:hypothetical protein
MSLKIMVLDLEKWTLMISLKRSSRELVMPVVRKAIRKYIAVLRLPMDSMVRKVTIKPTATLRKT